MTADTNTEMWKENEVLGVVHLVDAINTMCSFIYKVKSTTNNLYQTFWVTRYRVACFFANAFVIGLAIMQVSESYEHDAKILLASASLTVIIPTAMIFILHAITSKNHHSSQT
jgi:hypothetical protein